MVKQNLQQTLFSSFSPENKDSMPPASPNQASHIPLAEAMRPQTLDEVVGQSALFDEKSPFKRMIQSNKLSSFILWGPPGVGKTTIARLLAQQSGYVFKSISAIFSGVGELKKIFEEAQTYIHMGSKKMLLFVDEIHRFNRSQQDAFLPFVESGVITLIGATTENPSFEINSALLSRLQVFTVSLLNKAALQQLIEKAIVFKGKNLPLNPEALELLMETSGGDGRYLLTLVDSLYLLPPQDAVLDPKGLSTYIQKRSLLYDKNRDEHYNHISALHKSIRGSNVDASLYWFTRMVEGGEELRYIGRRLVRMALEDIGLADPGALTVALNALEAYERLGSPEGDLAFSQAVIYLALAPKSNRGYKAYGAAKQSVGKTGHLPLPLSILNAPTSLMSQQGYGKGYVYDHDVEGGVSGQNFWPQSMKPEKLYAPTTSGNEALYRTRKKELDQFFSKNEAPSTNNETKNHEA